MIEVTVPNMTANWSKIIPPEALTQEDSRPSVATSHSFMQVRKAACPDAEKTERRE